MITALDYYRELNIESVFLRLALAMIFGGMIGAERGKKRRAAGFRTHMLVCIGAALSGILSQFIFVMLSGPWAEIANTISRPTDVSRIGSQVIGGVGFLGAGTIMFTSRKEIKGLTTAAGLWASACVGIAVGAGFYEAVFLAFLLIYLIFKILPKIELSIVKHSKNMNIYIEVESSQLIKNLISTIKTNDIKILEMDIHRNRQVLCMMFSLKLQSRTKRERLISTISGMAGVLLIEEV